MAVDVGTAIAYLNLDATNFNTGLASVQTALSNLNNGAGGLSQVMGAAGAVTANFGTAMTRYVTTPLISAGQEVIQFSAQFDKQMSAVEAVMKNVLQPGDMERLRDAAVSWGEQTVYTATEAAEALYYMGLAGWDVDQAINGLGSVLNLAAAGSVDLGRAADIVTDSMTAMNLQAGQTTNGIENTSYYTSVLAAVMANANTDIDKMGESFKYVAPIAGQLNYSIEDLGLALGLAANAGIKSSQAGTSLRQALKQLISPTDKTATAMEKYGISLFDAEGQALPFRQIMLQLQQTFGDLGVEVLDANGDLKEGEAVMQEYANALPISQQEKLKAIVDLFGTRAMPTMLAIIQQAGTEFDKLASAIDEAANTGTYASEMAQTQMDNLQGDWTRFTSALGTTKIMLEEIVDGWLRNFVQQLTELVKKFNALDESQKEQIIKWGLIAAAIGPVLTIVGRFMTTISTLIPLFSNLHRWFTNIGEAITLWKAGWTALAGEASSFGSAIAQVGTKLNWVIAIIAAVITAIVDLWKNSDAFRGWVKDAFKSLMSAFQTIWNFLKKVFGLVGEVWMEVVRAIEPLVAVLVKELSPSLDAFMTLLEAHLNLILPLLQLVVDIIKLISPLLKAIMTVVAWIVEGITTFVNTIITIVSGLMDGLRAIIQPGLDFLHNLFGGWIEKIIDFFSDLKYNLIGDPIVVDLMEGIKSIFSLGLEFVLRLVETFVKGVIDFFTWLWEKGSEAVENLISGVKSAFEEFVRWFENTWNKFTVWLSSVWNNLKNSVQSAWNGFVSWLQNVWNDFVSKLVSSLQAVRDRIVDGFNKFIEIVKQLINNVVDFGKSLIANIKEIAINAWNAIVDGFKRAKEAITEGIKIIIEKLLELRDEVKQKFEEFIQIVKDKLIELILNAKENFEQLVAIVREKFEEVIENIRQKIEQAKEFLENLVRAIREKFEEILKAVAEHFKKIFEQIKEFGAKFVEAWKTAFQNVQNGIANVFNIIKEGFVKFGTYVFGVAKNVGNAFIKGLLGTGKSIKEFFTNFIKEAILGLLSKIQAFKQTGVEIINALWDGIKSAWSNLTEWLKEAWDALVSGKLFKTIGEKISTWFKFGVNGSHADGLSYVPFNGYIAELHKGERVLTAEENEKYSNGNGGVGDGTTINFYSNEKIDEYTAARELRRTIKDIELGLV